MVPRQPASTTRPATWRTFVAASAILIATTVAGFGWWLHDDAAVIAAAGRAEARLGAIEQEPLSSPTDPARVAAFVAAVATVSRIDRRDAALWSASNAYDDDAAWADARRTLDDAQVDAFLDALESIGTAPVVAARPSWSDQYATGRVLTLCARGGDAGESLRAELLKLRMAPSVSPMARASDIFGGRLAGIEAIARRPPRTADGTRAVADEIDAAADGLWEALRREARPFAASIAHAATGGDPWWRIGRQMGFRLDGLEEWYVFRQTEAKLTLPGDLDDLAAAAIAVSDATTPQEPIRSIPDFDRRLYGSPWSLHIWLQSSSETLFRRKALRALFARALARQLRDEPLPDDPFSPGAPLRSLVVDGRLQMVWSVGRDGHDDGGAGDDLLLLRRPHPRPK